jgi:hypothetical protein
MRRISVSEEIFIAMYNTILEVPTRVGANIKMAIDKDRQIHEVPDIAETLPQGSIKTPEDVKKKEGL